MNTLVICRRIVYSTYADVRYKVGEIMSGYYYMVFIWTLLIEGMRTASVWYYRISQLVSIVLFLCILYYCSEKT